MPGFDCGGVRNLENGVVPERNIRGGKQRGQNVHALAQTSRRVLPGARARDQRDFRIHHRTPWRADSAATAVSGSGAWPRYAKTLEPPLTRSPTLICRLAEVSR